MKNKARFLIPALLSVVPAIAQVQGYTNVTQQMLENPPAEDWLMYSRTYDAQRYSPLKQITKQNVHQLRMVWTRGIGPGQTETVPIVHNGVMYLVAPGAIVQALDATTGDLLWEYKRKILANVAGSARSKSLAIYQDIVAYTAPDGFVVGLDARTGEQRWETATEGRGNVSGPLIIEGKVVSGATCAGKRENCYIAAQDALTGKEVWRFYTAAGKGDPGDASWNGSDEDKRLASTWGLPGSYDPIKKLIYWGVANPMADQRASRHGGKADGTSTKAPADLYSNSTLALNPETGKLVWYYQHLPGDDWDSDYTHERTLVRTKFNPDPKYVKWINPDIQKGQERDMAVMIGEAGGIFALDRNDGKFLWANPFPADDPEHNALANVDPKTGQTSINEKLIFREPGDHHIVCFWNTRSYWPTAYSPETNSLYTSYIDNCRDLQTLGPAGRGGWHVVPRPGSDPNKLTGLAKINLSTGEILRFDVGRVPGNGAMLTTAGGLVFHGDMNRRFRAFDAATGKMLWEQIVGGVVSVSTITYSVKGKQYVSIMTGNNLKVPELLGEVPEIKVPVDHNAVYVFALP